MLNKRIKSLLVAGLLVFSMSGAVFAEGADLPKEATIKIEYPDFGAFSQKIYELQDGKIVLTLNDDSSGYRAFVNWVAEEYKVTQIRLIFDDESSSVIDVKLPGETKEGQNCYDAVLDGDKYKVSTGNITTDRQLIRVEIDYINLTKDDNPVTPPTPPTPPTEEPEEKVYDPETGDASIMPIVATAVLSAAGLYVVCKKDDEE